MQQLNSSNVTDFSFRMKDWDEPMSDRELLEQVRFYAIGVLNQVANGKNYLDENTIQSINFYNSCCHIVGLEPLELPN